MKLKQQGKAGTNGLDYFDICTNSFNKQFGYIARIDMGWKLYVMVNSEKRYFNGSFVDCIKKAEELTGDVF